MLFVSLMFLHLFPFLFSVYSTEQGSLELCLDRGLSVTLSFSGEIHAFLTLEVHQFFQIFSRFLS